MEELKVGEYIRTKEGNIFQITNYGLGETAKGDVLLVELNKDFEMERRNLDIVKHSKNIIDLIEVGDYVNGDKITSISQDPFIKGQINLWTDRYEIDCFGDRSTIKYTNKDIKSIVTKEQFVNAEYRLED